MLKVSVIVPVYKVEKYLDRCIKSIINQTYSDLEIILVDDGTPDKSGFMCDAYSEKDNRIQVIHKENGGLSSARNAGLDIASGDYIVFIDSDDEIELNMVEKLVNAADYADVDFVMCDYIHILSDGREIKETTALEAGLYDKTKLVKDIFPNLIMAESIEYGPILSVWHCMYKRCFLKDNNLRFAEDVKWSEDNLFNSIVGYKAQTFFYLKNEFLYKYYQNPGTITTSYRQGAWNVYKTMNNHLKDYFLFKEDYDFGRQLQLHLIYYACNTIGMEGLAHTNKKEAIHGVREILNDSLLENVFNEFTFPKVNLKLKLQLWLMKHKFAFILVCIMRR